LSRITYCSRSSAPARSGWVGHRGDDPVGEMAQRLDDQIGLGGEVVRLRAPGDARPGHDLRGGQAVVTHLGEHVERGIEQGPARRRASLGLRPAPDRRAGVHGSRLTYMLDGM
jgi:hypothetical protein